MPSAAQAWACARLPLADVLGPSIQKKFVEKYYPRPRTIPVALFSTRGRDRTADLGLMSPAL